MEIRSFGTTGIFVPILGLGAGKIGDPAFDEREASTLLNTALDWGISLIDTARSYGLSEERIGKHLSHRRDDFNLSTKVGYGVPPYPDWTGECVAAGVDLALKLLRTDRIDIVHLHSCPISVLERDDIIRALQDAVRSGKVRVTAYSGDNEPLDWVVRSGQFGSIQASINVCDQRILNGTLSIAQQSGMGVIAKRPLANAPWRYQNRPEADEATQAYWERWNQMKLEVTDMPPEELALRFVISLPGVHTCLVGTQNLHHLQENVDAISKGPLPDELVKIILETYQKHDQNWMSQV